VHYGYSTIPPLESRQVAASALQASRAARNSIEARYPSEPHPASAVLVKLACRSDQKYEYEYIPKVANKPPGQPEVRLDGSGSSCSSSQRPSSAPAFRIATCQCVRPLCSPFSSSPNPSSINKPKAEATDSLTEVKVILIPHQAPAQGPGRNPDRN
jgi:hypothetical protein